MVKFGLYWIRVFTPKCGNGLLPRIFIFSFPLEIECYSCFMWICSMKQLLVKSQVIQFPVFQWANSWFLQDKSMNYQLNLI